MARSIIHVPRRFVADAWGGTETVILELSRQQQRAGFEPRIVTSLALAPAGARREDIEGIPVERHPYCYPFLGLSPTDRAALDQKGGNLLSLSLFRSLLRLPDVRIYHAHTLKRVGGMVRTAARLRHKPYVVSLHGGVHDVPAAEAAALSRPIQGRFEWGRPFGALLGSRRVLEDADHVLCVGLGEYELARKSLPHDRISHLPNGVDVARFAAADGPAFRARLGIPGDAFLVLQVARLDSQKNQPLLLEAFTILHRRVRRARLLFVGPETEPGYAGRLRTAISAAGLDQAVSILPGLRGGDPALIQAYHACDAFVLPSRHEPFGIVVLEAWSAARPVIASRVGGLRDLIRDDQTGWLLDLEAAGAARTLADALTRLVDEPATARRLAEAGLQEARRRYDWRAIHTQLEAVYQTAEEHAARRRRNRTATGGSPNP